jgi:hypothetical protein
VQLQPLVDALAAELLRQPVLHADETPVAMLKPGHGKTHRAYLWRPWPHMGARRQGCHHVASRRRALQLPALWLHSGRCGGRCANARRRPYLGAAE